jgi:hypothetical protein
MCEYCFLSRTRTTLVWLPSDRLIFYPASREQLLASIRFDCFLLQLSIPIPSLTKHHTSLTHIYLHIHSDRHDHSIIPFSFSPY